MSEGDVMDILYMSSSGTSVYIQKCRLFMKF